jgi:SOS-response transcriptional repressor LexA
MSAPNRPPELAAGPELTTRQRDCLIGIQQLLAAIPIPPSLEEIAAHLGWPLSRAHGAVRELQAAGAIFRDPRRNRSLRVLTPIAITATRDDEISPFMKQPLRPLDKAVNDLLTKYGHSDSPRAQQVRQLISELGLTPATAPKATP